MTPSRRTLAKSLLATPFAAAAATVAMPGFGSALSQPVGAPPPIAQLKIGRFIVTLLTDGYFDAPFGFFTGTPPAEIAARAGATGADRGDALRLTFTQYLIEDGERTILVDTGPAGGIGENTGRLPAALRELGVTSADIDAVILTHTHFDHISGMLADGRAMYPDAEVYVDRRDIAHFTDPARRAAAPDFLLSSFDATSALVQAYPRLQQTDGATRIANGINIVDLTGHTPGHVGVRVSDAGKTLVISSDMLFHPVVHPASAQAGFVFEQDAAASEAMRTRFFAEAEADGTLIAATHMPFPGIGRIVSDRGQREWVPAEWLA